jgi:hypothetical protein
VYACVFIHLLTSFIYINIYVIVIDRNDLFSYLPMYSMSQYWDFVWINYYYCVEKSNVGCNTRLRADYLWDESVPRPTTRRIAAEETFRMILYDFKWVYKCVLLSYWPVLLTCPIVILTWLLSRSTTSQVRFLSEGQTSRIFPEIWPKPNFRFKFPGGGCWASCKLAVLLTNWRIAPRCQIASSVPRLLLLVYTVTCRVFKEK